MASSLQTLTKVLELEKQKGYQNKAVIGGFARFAYHWSREAHNQAKTDQHHELVDEIVNKLRSYEAASQTERPELLETLISLASVKMQAEDVDEEIGITPPAPERQTGRLLAAPQADVDDVGIGLPDEEDSEDSDTAQEEYDEIDVFGTFEHDAAEDEQRSVRERRGYEWQQQPIPLSAEAMAELDSPVENVSGVGKTRAEQLNRLGVYSTRDLLFLFPRRHDDYSRMKTISKLVVGEVVTVIGIVDRISSQSMRHGGARTEAFISDGSANLRLNWFNQPWMEKQLESGEPYVVSGKIEQYLGRLVMNSPEIEPIERDSLNAGRIVPVYPLTKGLSGKVLRRLVHDNLSRWAAHMSDYLPLPIRQEQDLMNYGDALFQAHFPDTPEDLFAAHQRLTFDELFLLQMAMLRRRYEWQSRSGTVLTVPDDWLDSFEARLPFRFTDAQRRAVNEIRHDLATDVPMNRLLQGDVGSGKTAVAAAAAGIAVANLTQVAIMAPTSILAEQHFEKFKAFFDSSPLGSGVNVALLTGKLSQAEKDAVYAGLADGSINVVVGTHALIQPGVQFHYLGLAVIDEQHRFGVSQRGALRDKAGGGNPHLLVMTATPIPRTLALTLHADLDLTIIDELPPGRTPIETRVLQPKERERAYRFIRSQVEKGHQAYVICPLVAESDKLDAKSAIAEYERLQQQVFPDLACGLVHGQMSNEQKELEMARFYAGETHILISTTVIEVGIDVPNATTIMIENANRFGLSQLHQLRGRVGRGEENSYCLLVSDKPFMDEDGRLKAVESTTDGFKLAEIDWKMRGAGDLLGDRQSGVSRFHFIEFIDPHLVEQVQMQSRSLYEQDPQLAAPEHQHLAELVASLAAERGNGDIS